MTSNKQVLDKLRAEAEKLLNKATPAPGLQLSDKQIGELLQELQVQQIELEMQNDELKISNEEMEAQRIKFAGLYDLAPVGYFILDGSGVIEEVNSTGIHLLDSNKRTLLNRRFLSFVNADNTQLFYTFFQRMLTSSTRQSCQVTMITPKGHTFYAQVEGTAVRRSFIDKTQCYLAVIDITERRNAEIKQHETMERLALALDASGTGTWEIDSRSGNVYLDDFCQEIFGVKNSFDGHIDTFLKTIHPDDRRKTDDSLRHAINGNKDLDIEFRVIREDKITRYVNARGHVVPNSKGEDAGCFVGVLTDITEKTQLELETLNLRINQQKSIQSAALQAQENERKRISEALHDSVSQLLYGIKLKLEQNKDASSQFAGLFGDVKQMLEQAIKETRNISFELAPSILKDFGLATTIEEMAKRLRTNGLSIKPRVDVDKELPLNIQTSVFRIVQELVNNCIKHSGATEINIEVIQKNKSIRIAVNDNGLGFKVSDNKEPMGTGLASIKNRISLLNGKMKIDSKAGNGTRIIIALKA